MKLLFLLPLLLGLMSPAIAHNEANSEAVEDTSDSEKAGKEEGGGEKEGGEKGFD